MLGCGSAGLGASLLPPVPGLVGPNAGVRTHGNEGRRDVAPRFGSKRPEVCLVAPLSIRIAGGAHRGRRLRSARVAGLRPTSEVVRAAMFSILGPEAIEGALVLDLYAGTGILGLEALSRGASWADFVEANARLAQRIRENLLELSLSERGHVYRAKVKTALGNLRGGYDAVFCDPPYDMHDWGSLMGRLSEGELVKAGGIVVVEHRYDTALAERYGTLVRAASRRHGGTSVSFFRAEAVDG